VPLEHDAVATGAAITDAAGNPAVVALPAPCDAGSLSSIKSLSLTRSHRP
jgi:hypothetical protein